MDGDKCVRSDCKRRAVEMQARIDAMEAMAGEPGLLRLLVDLRFALGDNGRRMQDELVEYARGLAGDARRYRWIRSASTPGYLHFPGGQIDDGLALDALDTAIDAAIGAESVRDD